MAVSSLCVVWASSQRRTSKGKCPHDLSQPQLRIHRTSATFFQACAVAKTCLLSGREISRHFLFGKFCKRCCRHFLENTICSNLQLRPERLRGGESPGPHCVGSPPSHHPQGPLGMYPLPPPCRWGPASCLPTPQAPHKKPWLSLHLACGMDLSLGGKKKKKKGFSAYFFSAPYSHVAQRG